MRKLLRLLSGADSKTVARVEQYQDVRTTVKSVEITVERAEMTRIEKEGRTICEIDQGVRLDDPGQ